MEEVAQMIDAKQAAVIARQKTAEMLDQDLAKSSLEEIERDSYKPRDLERLQGLAQLAADLVAMKL
jgi:hypothetical protein